MRLVQAGRINYDRNIPFRLASDYAPLCRSSQACSAPQWGVPLNDKERAQLKAFGANIRRERIGKGLTQEKLAELVDLNIRTVQKIEAGHVNILLTTILRMLFALGCSSETLLGELRSRNED